MLLVLLNWFTITLICLFISDLAYSFFDAKQKIKDQDFILKFLFGFITVSFIGNILSLFCAVGQFYFLLLLGVSVIYAHRCKRNLIASIRGKLFDLSVTEIVAAIIFATIALIFTSQSTLNVDEGGYYLPLVRWIENYPVVKGCGLFNARIAHNSIYYTSQAIFGHADWFTGGMYDLNGLLFLLFNITAIQSLIKLLKKNYNNLYKDVFLASALIFPFSFLVDSMDTDYPTIFLGIYFLGLILNRIAQNRFWEIDYEYYALGLLASYLLMSKLFSGALIVFPLIIILKNLKEQHFKSLTISSLIFLGIFAPWFIRNYIMSGYLIYPLYFIDLFNVDWKIPIDLAKQHYLVIQDFAKTEIIRETYYYEGVQELKFNSWIKAWLHRNWNLIIGKCVILLLPFSFLLSIFFVITKRIDKRILTVQTFIFFIITYWFFHFPSIRFCWAFILCFLSVGFVQLFKTATPKLKHLLIQILAIICMLSIGRTMIKAIKTFDSSNILTPNRTLELEDSDVFLLDKINVIQSHTEYCHGAQPPCMPYNNPLVIKNKGSDVKNGFSLEK